MGVQLLIHRKGAAEPEYYSLTGATGWATVWLPAAEELELDLVPLLGDGAFSSVPAEHLPKVIEQLSRLQRWMSASGHDLYVEHLNNILPALTAVNPQEDDVSFG